MHYSVFKGLPVWLVSTLETLLKAGKAAEARLLLPIMNRVYTFLRGSGYCSMQSIMASAVGRDARHWKNLLIRNGFPEPSWRDTN